MTIPVTIVTGFLGSGKTTLLRRLLAARGVRDVAVLVNEVAEVGVDHKLLRPYADDVRVLENGCVCCAMREDLRASLAGLLARTAAKAVSHVVIETTGLADPMPILETFASDPMLRHQFRIGAVVTAVDSVNAPVQLRENPEFTRQLAAADRIVLTKTDLADAASVAASREAIARINPVVPVTMGSLEDATLAGELLREVESSALDDAARFLRLVRAQAGESPRGSAFASPDLAPSPVHRSDVASFCITPDAAFDWAAFAVWLTLLLHAHGDRILRVKGILEVSGSETPISLNGVRRLVHRPEHLPRWPDEDRRSVLVFIVAGMDPDAIRRSFAAFVGQRRGAATPAAA